MKFKKVIVDNIITNKSDDKNTEMKKLISDVIYSREGLKRGKRQSFDGKVKKANKIKAKKQKKKKLKTTMQKIKKRKSKWIRL
jgi:hypothetical protein